MSQKKRLGLPLPLSGLAFREDGGNKRPAFPVKWIRETIRAPGALAELNTKARCLLLGMINTGYRPSEVEGLLAKHIRLDADIPYIRFEPIGRPLKTPASRRTIPLAGVSLEAFRQCPQGFPRYQTGAGCTNLLNKFLRHNGLIPEDGGQTVYSLRQQLQGSMPRRWDRRGDSAALDGAHFRERGLGTSI